MSNEEQTHLLHVGDTAYHLPSRRGATVQHISARRGMVLLRFAGGVEQSRPVGELRVRDARTDDWTMKCRVSE